MGLLDSKSIEQRTVEFIPVSERHGKPSSLFTVWFTANMNMTTVVAGMLSVAAFGLPLGWAILSIIVGMLIGTVFMAYHSAQGPKLGIPQMIQSRAQFGFFGAILPLVLVVLMYIGFFSLGAVLGGGAIAKLLHVPTNVGILIINAICLVTALYGYDLVHKLEKWSALVLAVIFVAITIKLLVMGGTPPKESSVSVATFLLGVSIPATWEIAFAPYVADYSRYLPEDTSTSRAFWYTYLGSFIGGTWCMILGALAAWFAGSAATDDASGFFGGLLGSGLSWLILITIAIGIIGINTLNLYGPFMVSMTVLTSFKTLRTRGPVLRLIITAICCVLGTVVAMLIKGNLVLSFDNFLVFILYLLVPWTAINLMDFYVVRKGRYSIPDIFTPEGIYGRANVRTLCIYAVTLAIEIPFMSLPFYTGPIAPKIGGTDIAWIIGLIVPAILYWALTLNIARETNRLAAAGKLTTGQGGSQYSDAGQSLPVEAGSV